MLFPIAEYWWFYLAFKTVNFVLLMLALDLGVFHRKSHTVSVREAARWSVAWVTLSMVFAWLFYRYALTPLFDPGDHRAGGGGARVPGRVCRGCHTLSVDNMFVFLVIFSFFNVPSHLQHRVLFYGILGALVFRAIFIGLGSILLAYHWVVVVFGVLLIATGIKMLRARRREHRSRAQPAGPTDTADDAGH